MGDNEEIWRRMNTYRSILLNNGDILESMKNNIASNNNLSKISGPRIGNKLQKKCKSCKKEVDEDYSACPYCGNNTFE